MTTVEGLQTEIDSRLPSGSTADDVLRWLDAEGIENSGVIDNAGLAHMGFDPDTLEIKAIIRSKQNAALVRSDTQITFVFDRGQRLVRSRVELVHTGL